MDHSIPLRTIYKLKEELIRRIPKSLNIHIKKYSKEAIVNRGLQIILDNHTNLNHTNILEHPSSDDILIIGKNSNLIKKHPLKGVVILELTLALRLFFRSTAKAIYLLWMTIASKPPKRIKTKCINLFFGFNFFNFNSYKPYESFEKYLESGQIGTIGNTESVSQIIETSGFKCRENYFYTSRPLLFLLKNLSPKEKFKFSLKVCRFVVQSLFTAVQRINLSVIFLDDQLEELILETISARYKIRNIYLTISNYNRQPLYFNLPDRTFSTHLVWYATNTIPLSFKDQSKNFHTPLINLIKADKMYTWTLPHKEWLKKATKDCEIILTNPILMHLPENNPSAQRDIDLLIFDVTPTNPIFFEERIHKNFYNYYTTETCISFLKDVIEVAQDLNLNVFLKQKRNLSDSHSSEYINFLGSLKNSSKIKEIDYNESLYTCISEAKVCISIPYSSPSMLANLAGKPAFYYDPTATLCNFEMHTKNMVPTLSNKINLKEAIKEVLPNFK